MTPIVDLSAVLLFGPELLSCRNVAALVDRRQRCALQLPHQQSARGADLTPHGHGHRVELAELEQVVVDLDRRVPRVDPGVV